MCTLKPPFKFNFTGLLKRAKNIPKTNIEGITIKLPFVSFSFHPDDIEKKVAQEIVIRLADKRVLNSGECCDNCIDKALVSLNDIRSILVDKQVELSDKTENTLYLLIEMMLEGIRQFFTFEENLQKNPDDYPGDLKKQLYRTELQPYSSVLEMLRGHLYRCLSQLSLIGDITIPKIAETMRYDDV